MAGKPTDGLSPHAIRCEPYNDGHWCFAYDATHEDRLRELNAHDVLIGLAGGTEAEDTLAEIGAEGLAIGWELVGDHEVIVDVLVGRKLTAAQKKKGEWLKAQGSCLSLPTGRLRIETLNSLAFSPDEPTSPGSEIEVEPGEYDVSVLRASLESDEEASSVRLPTEVLTLTPVKAKGPKKRAASLTLADALGEDGLWLRAGAVVGDAFEGTTKAHAYDRSVVHVNFRQLHAEQLGVRFGDTLRIEAGDASLDAPYIGCLAERGLDQFFGEAWYRRFVAEASHLCGLSPFGGSGPWILAVERPRRQGDAELPADSGATVRRGEPWHPPLVASEEDVGVQKGRITGRAIFVSSQTVILNLGGAARRAAKIDHGDLLSLEWAGGRRVTVQDASTREAKDEIRESFLAEGRPDRVQLRARLADARARASEASGRVIVLGHEGEDTTEWAAKEAAARADVEELKEQLESAWPSDEHFRAVPLLLRSMTHWERPDTSVFWLRPIAGEVHHLEIETGAEVTLTVAD